MNIKSASSLLAFALCAMISIPALADERVIMIDEIPSNGYYIQDWGSPEINRSVAGTPLSIGGKVYEHGIGTHAISRMLFGLDGKALRLQGTAGPDDNNKFVTDFRFKIFGDGRELWSSKVMNVGSPAEDFDIDLTGLDKVLLLVEECGDGIMYDHADWVDVKFVTDGSNVRALPVWAAPVKKEAYILTPKAPERPIINNAAVYGATPGAPFLWNVMASGAQPMKYEVKGLPKGLKYDKKSGIISGSVAKAGDYRVTLKASNAFGSDTKDVTIKIGDSIALTPPMGWNSYNCFCFDADDAIVRRTAEIMHDHLQPYGWNYVNVDDGWEAAERDADGVLNPNQKFPDIKSVTDYLHSMGIKFGIYSSPGPTTCGRFLASYQHEMIDAKTWADWGVDYLKHDYCGYAQVERDCEDETLKEPYGWMREALDSCGRDIVYCVGYGAPRVWIWGAEAGGNQWRTTRDITDEWNVVLAIGTFQDVCAQATKPGRFNDPDMMVVGTVGGGWGKEKHPSLLTPDEQYCHVSLWALLTAPLLLGCDMEALDEFTLSLLTNREVIAINQDELCAPATKKIVENGQIWYKQLADGSIALGCFNVDPYFVLWNQDDAEAMQYRDYNFTVDLAELGIEGPVTVRDVWRNADILTDITGSFDVTIPYHGVKLLKITPVR